MAFLPLPNVISDVGPGGRLFTNFNAVSKEGLARRKEELANQYYGPKTNAEITHALAQAGLLGSEKKKNEFQIANPQYMNPEGFLYSKAFGTNNENNSSSTNPMQNVDAQTREDAGMPGSRINPNPLGSSLVQQKLDPAGYQAKVHQNQANIDTNNKLITEASSQANNAVNMNYALDSMDKAYPELNMGEKGSVLGHGPALSSAAQQFDHAAVTLKNSLIQANQTGHITDKDLNFFSQLGVGRNLNKKSFEVLSGFNRAMQDRIKEKAPFYSTAAAAGIPPNIYQPLYSMYLNERPVYDYDNSKPIKKNQGSWRDYLTPQAVQAMQNGEQYSPRLNTEKKEKTKVINGITYKTINGKWHSI
jgi:hypothetical protein